jgi:hypothetical protein
MPSYNFPSWGMHLIWGAVETPGWALAKSKQRWLRGNREICSMLPQIYRAAFCWLGHFSSLMQEKEMALFLSFYIYIYIYI